MDLWRCCEFEVLRCIFSCMGSLFQEMLRETVGGHGSQVPLTSVACYWQWFMKNLKATVTVNAKMPINIVALSSEAFALMLILNPSYFSRASSRQASWRVTRLLFCMQVARITLIEAELKADGIFVTWLALCQVSQPYNITVHRRSFTMLQCCNAWVVYMNFWSPQDAIFVDGRSLYLNRWLMEPLQDHGTGYLVAMGSPYHIPSSKWKIYTNYLSRFILGALESTNKSWLRFLCENTDPLKFWCDKIR